MAERTCTIEGCGRKHEARGWCHKHYQQWRKTGSPFSQYDEREAFWSRVDVSEDCWEWLGDVTQQGYGQFKRNTLAHRWSYENLVGVITADSELDHLCPSRTCVNPDHLSPHEPRSQQEINAYKNEWARRWRVANPDKAAEKYRRDYWDNRDKQRARYRRWHQANRERRADYGRQWRESNPKRVAEGHRRRRARKLSALTISFTPEQLDARMSMFAYACWMCGGPFEQVDHVKPLAKGGPHVLANLRPACKPCNIRKGGRWPLDPLADQPPTSKT